MAGTILDRLEEYTQKDPLAPILFDETYTKGITYHQLDEMSGRVYAWLAQAGIGKEDFVLIDLPRGVLPIVAAYTAVPSGYTDEHYRHQGYNRCAGCCLRNTDRSPVHGP